MNKGETHHCAACPLSGRRIAAGYPDRGRILPCVCLSALICILVCGCIPRGDTQQPPAGYFGPTEPFGEVVAEINANNELLPTLRGAGEFEAWIADGDDLRFINGQVTLLFSRPESMRLIGRKDIAGQVFDIGTNPQRYWVIVRGETDTMWTGTLENLGRVDPGQIPIQPDLVMEVLGIQPINTNFLQPPVPVMRFNNDADAYMFVWHVPLANRWAALKEIWYDRTTRLPRLVALFDEQGRIVLSAYLSEHRPVAVPNLPREQWPSVATHYRLFFPETGSKMTIDLDDVALSRNNAPNERSFLFPGENAGVSRVIELDEQNAP